MALDATEAIHEIRAWIHGFKYATAVCRASYLNSVTGPYGTQKQDFKEC